MAIVRLADYFSNHRRIVILATAVVQLLVTVALFILLLTFGVDIILASIYVILPVVILQAFAFIIILNFSLAPLKVLTTVVTHVSPEPSDVQPPNLNGTYHEKTGLKRMAQTIYDLSINEGKLNQSPQLSVADDEQASKLLDDLPVGIIALNAERQIIYTNKAAPIQLNSQGYKTIQLMFEQNARFEDWLTKAENNSLSTGRTWTRVANVLPDQPNRRIYDVIANYQKSRSSGLDTLIICADRTDHYAVDEEDMDFIALAAHELRGPITVIRGYLDVIAEELNLDQKPDQKLLLERLSVAASRLSGYVNNILNVARYDRRHLSLHLKEDRLLDVYQTVADDLSLRARAQGRNLSINIPADLPTVAADRNSLSEVIANLVDNAIKYSRSGGQITISAQVDGSFVKLNVQDSGIGIPSSVVGHLFTKFYRSHRSRTNVTGTGLGLYISKAIIESHGGKIGVSSIEGQGSTFSFSLPTYASVADKIKSGNQQAITTASHGWIKNHSMYKG